MAQVRMHGLRNHQTGVALAMVLWFIAALALLVAGIVSIARTDVRQVQLQLQLTQAAAAGDGASMLAMRDLLLSQEEGEFKGRGVLERSYTIGVQRVRVQAFPSTGLVNLNRASPELLAEVFKNSAGLSEEQAQEIAENIIIWRRAGGLKEDEASAAYEQEGKIGPRYGQFEVVEDVMQVLGVNRDMYEAIAEVLAASAVGQPGIDPLSASAAVLAVITGDAEIAGDIVATRAESPFEEQSISADLPEEYISQGANGLFRVDADVTMEDGQVYRRRRWIQRGAGSLDQLPWNVLRSEPVKVVGMAVQQ